MKSMQKQISLGATSSHDANFLLGFSYRDDEESYGGATYNNRRRKPARNYRPAKDYSVLSAFKFIVKESHEEFLL